MIKHANYEDGVKDIFQLKVVSGKYAGLYDILKPIGIDGFDCIVDIDKEFFNINNIIIGETEKIVFSEYYDPETFNLVRNVYEEQGGDGVVIFYWKKDRNGEIYDFLDENFALNFNKYKEKFSKSRRKIEIEIKERDEQNLLLTREETSVNLFALKDLNDNATTSVTTTEIMYKEASRRLTNFYLRSAQDNDENVYDVNYYMWEFSKSDGSQIGDNGNIECGMTQWRDKPAYHVGGAFLQSASKLRGLKVEFSNWKIWSLKPFSLYTVRRSGKYTELSRALIKEAVISEENPLYYEIKILNETFPIGDLEPSVWLEFAIAVHNGNADLRLFGMDSSIEIHQDIYVPIRKSKTVLLKDAFKQLSKQYTSGKINIESSIIDNGGNYEKTAVSTGLFLRGVANVFLSQEKLTTSLKALFHDCASPLMALGYDLDSTKLIIEDINYFFKDIQSYDFSDKDFIQNDFIIENDSETTYNNLVFGTKKYSINNNLDLKNFNTKIEVSTPIKSIKNKFDKTSDCIIDDIKIQELILDDSSATNDNDDDLVFIDLVGLETYVDEGVLIDCYHGVDISGYLWLTCFVTPFDTLPLVVGDTLIITDGANNGTWTILDINKSKCKLNKNSLTTAQGIFDTPIRFTINNIIKNRSDEGFTNLVNIQNVQGTSNIRHNPKYQMARWFAFYGGGLVNKDNNENLIVSNYKNNGNVSIEWVAPELNNELPGTTLMNQNEPLGRLRNYKTPFFSGQKIEIKLIDVSFDEFFTFLNNWRRGIGNDRKKSRGYLTVKINGKFTNIYPFGDEAINFNKNLNQLTIKGKIKNIYYDDLPFRYFDEFFDYEFE